ncbi:hypothetical protein [Aliivibrio kagoshimensis]|uniref:hypothetical protein n=1 Tax=Aliivibrio kagoshimensis TaxID=2910230 RepID=UPI003D0CB6F8
MPESKNNYSHLNVPASNFYSPSLYGQDVEAFHQNNSRELMLRYVKTMKISRYVLIAVFITIYVIAGFDLGNILPIEMFVYIKSNLDVMSSIYSKVIVLGGDEIDFSNITVILMILIPMCIVLGIYLSLLEVLFLMRFNFAEFLSELSPSNWRIFAALLGGILFISSIFLAYSTVGQPDPSGRLSFLWNPIDSLPGYTMYVMCAYGSMRGIPAFVTSIYILILKDKGEIK